MTILPKLISSSLLFIALGAHACDPLFNVHEYKLLDGITIYTERSISNRQTSFTISLPLIRFATLTPAKSSASTQGSQQNTLLQYQSFSSEELTIGAGQYFTDGQFVLWNGVIMQNGPNEPAVDVKSFVRSISLSGYAMDKHSMYFNGKRRADLQTRPRMNIGQLSIKEDGVYISDGVHLYANGQYLGTNKGFRLIQKQNIGLWCEPLQKIQTIAANQEHVFVNGEILHGADVASFEVIQWQAKENHLHYRDKHGEHWYRG